MSYRHLILALGLAIAPAGLNAQQAAPAARIDAALSTATRVGIPTSLLESKVQEGRAKGIPDVRIAAAVEARLDALVRARTALDRARAQAIGAAELSVAADALQAGVTETSMVEVMTRVSAPRRAVAAAVLTELVELGVASDVALARVHAAIAQGGEALVNLPAQASENARGRGRVNGPPVEVDATVRGRGRNNNPND